MKYLLLLLFLFPTALSSHEPIYLGDANGDNVVNLADAAYIINYVLNNGPAPVEVETLVLNRLDNIKVLLEFYMISSIDWPCSCQYVNPDTGG